MGLEFSVEIAGDGPLRPALEKHTVELGIADRVRFIGHVDDVAQLLSEASFVVHTALAEGCPNSVMETMACGRTVVATNAGDISSLIEHENTGFVVCRDEDTAFVESIRRLIMSPELCCRMGEAARKKAEREFGLIVCRRNIRSISVCWLDSQFIISQPAQTSELPHLLKGILMFTRSIMGDSGALEARYSGRCRHMWGGWGTARVLEPGDSAAAQNGAYQGKGMTLENGPLSFAIHPNSRRSRRFCVANKAHVK